MEDYVRKLGQRQPKQVPRCVGKCRGPSLEQWVAAGYSADHYPPQGYAATSVPCCLREDAEEA